MPSGAPSTPDIVLKLDADVSLLPDFFEPCSAVRQGSRLDRRRRSSWFEDGGWRER
jgi:hypothetical protein